MGHLNIKTYYSMELPIKSSLILWFTTNLIVKNPAGDFLPVKKTFNVFWGSILQFKILNR